MENLTVWKYTLTTTDSDIAMPVGAKLLHVSAQDVDLAGIRTTRGVCIWAEVLTDRPTEIRRFRVVPTGGEVPFPGEYVGTALTVNGLVWHVYEIEATS